VEFKVHKILRISLINILKVQICSFVQIYSFLMKLMKRLDKSNQNTYKTKTHCRKWVPVFAKISFLFSFCNFGSYFKRNKQFIVSHNGYFPDKRCIYIRIESPTRNLQNLINISNKKIDISIFIFVLFSTIVQV
jgi:hypothetical protein